MGTERYEREYEYWEELLEEYKSRVAGYCSFAVSQDGAGAIREIRGQLLFEQELKALSEPVFLPEEVRSYEAMTGGFEHRYGAAMRKAKRYIAEGGIISMEYLFQMFGLDFFERYLVRLSFCMELDGQFERIFCLLQDDFSGRYPTADLAIRMYTLDEEKRRNLLVQLVERREVLSWFFGDSFQAFSEEQRVERRSSSGVSLKLDARIVNYFMDVQSDDELLADFSGLELPRHWQEDMIIRGHTLSKLVQIYEGQRAPGLCYLSGEPGIGKKFMVRHLCQRLHKPLLLVNSYRMFQKKLPTELLVKRLMREAVMKGNAVLCFADFDFGGEEEFRRSMEDLLWELKKYRQKVFVTAVQKWMEVIDPDGLDFYRLPLPSTDVEERIALWKYFLHGERCEADLPVERLADKYLLSCGDIKKSVKETKSRIARGETKEITEAVVSEACQKQLVHQLKRDAFKINPTYVWDDLILPEAQKRLLQNACNEVKFHHQVYQKWGFDQKIAYGRGVSILFYGPPGTGKTMGAQVLANELKLELYKVDMSGVLSKYVGESEKKLGTIFDQGRKSQSILFFDEADALFGKRSEVKDAQDKYANASTAYLLQKIEEYEGIIILATNLFQNFDAAFCRRFKYIIEFPAPDRERRLQIWKQAFPKQAKLDEVPDFEYLAEKFNFSGSQIKSAVLSAAFLAAGEQRGITMKHILMAIQRERKKTGKNMLASDFGRYYYLMEGEQLWQEKN